MLTRLTSSSKLQLRPGDFVFPPFGTRVAPVVERGLTGTRFVIGHGMEPNLPHVFLRLVGEEVMAISPSGHISSFYTEAILYVEE